jgi:hemolysin III
VTTQANRPREQALDPLRDQVKDALQEIKPRLRGWLHVGVAPLALLAGIVLTTRSPSTETRVGSAVFTVCAVALFTVSATMHRGRWSPRTNTVLTRLDHAAIFLLIAGSYTPFTLLLLEGGARTTLLWLVWAGAAAGIAFRLGWPAAPRRLYTPVYIALGWSALLFADDFVRNGSAPVLCLLLLGGLLYTTGALVYALRRPDPFPSLFGFHEVFHSLTVVAFAVHYVGISIATQSLR